MAKPGNRESLNEERREYHRNYEWGRRLRVKYGVDPEWYAATLEAQNSRCAICGTNQWDSRGRRPSIDHDHETDRVRGLLCERCNLALGYFDDNPQILREAASYLEGFT